MIRYSILGLVLATAFGVIACTSGKDSMPQCVEDKKAMGLEEVDALAACLSVALVFTDEAECVDYVSRHGGFADVREAACAIVLTPPDDAAVPDAPEPDAPVDAGPDA